MAEPTTITGDQILIQVEMVPGSGTYAHPCLINSDRGFARSANVISEVVPDCDDPSAPAWTSTEVDGLAASISGSGMLDLTSLPDFDEWYESGTNRNVKVKLGTAGGRTYTGAYKLTQFDQTGTRKTRATASITLNSDGVVTSAANA
jgi:hypothetical protein